MKKFIYWLMGETGGKATIAVWNWLWGIPNESPEPEVSLEAAEQSLQLMQESVKKLEKAVSTQTSVYQRAKQTYQAKLKEIEKLEQIALQAERNRNEPEARLALSKAIQIEKMLPQFAEQVKRAEDYVNLSQQRLHQERMKLEACQTDLANLKDMQEINQALELVAKVNDELNINSARSQFEEIKNSVEQRHLEQQALAELTMNAEEKLGADIERLATEEEVSRRLESFRKSHQLSD
ncbi:MAG: PspA/IM30 family protein [Lyngbya sp.]|nr:PspA/IM30 family protein [Lyngbya sp.]